MIVFSLDGGIYGGFANVDNWALPAPAYLGFSARTGGATNNHWVSRVTWGGAAQAAGLLSALPSNRMDVPMAAPLATRMQARQFTLSGSAVVSGDVLSITQTELSQAGTAFAALTDPTNGAPLISTTEPFSVQFQMYCGDGTGADGLCVNVGGNDMGGRVGEDGVAKGVAVCFDEWANNGDHGVSIFYDGGMIWEEIGVCSNRQNCLPVSLFDDATWVRTTPRLWGTVPTR